MLDGLEPDETIQKLCKLPWATTFTTNFDEIIDKAYRSEMASIGRQAIIVKEDDLKLIYSTQISTIF